MASKKAENIKRKGIDLQSFRHSQVTATATDRLLSYHVGKLAKSKKAVFAF